MASVFSTDWRDDVMKLSSDYKNNKNKPLVFSVYMIGDIDYMSPAYVHEIKNEEGKKGNQNFTYKELLELAEELKNMNGGK